jgi:hypothetical protein
MGRRLEEAALSQLPETQRCTTRQIKTWEKTTKRKTGLIDLQLERRFMNE